MVEADAIFRIRRGEGKEARQFGYIARNGEKAMRKKVLRLNLTSITDGKQSRQHVRHERRWLFVMRALALLSAAETLILMRKSQRRMSQREMN